MINEKIDSVLMFGMFKGNVFLYNIELPVLIENKMLLLL